MYLIFKHKTFTNFFFFKLIYDILKCDIFYYREQLLESYKYDPLGEKYTRLQFTLLSHPMIRYRRYVVNDLLNVTGNLIIIMSDYNSIYLNHVLLFDKFAKQMKIIYSKLNIYTSFFFLISSMVNAIIIIK